MNAVRPERGPQMDAFLSRIGWEGAVRRMLAGDASFRRYERVEWQGRIAVLMDAPPPWEDVRPFIAVTKHLEACGASVPGIIAADEAEGFLLLEDLGDASFTRLLKADAARELELYMAATDALVEIVRLSPTLVIPAQAGIYCQPSMVRAPFPAVDSRLRGNDEVILPPYDMAVYLREAGLFAEWFLPQVYGIEKARELREEWLVLWRGVIAEAGLQQACLVHRDYHADNLFWLHGRDGHRAVGMLDYQDALWGDAAYDLASLLEDARRDVSPTTVKQCIAHFVKQLGEDPVLFRQRYAVLAAQRNAKIIGIFVRLCVRDGKAHYLDYLPRVWGHFLHDITHPALGPVKQFVEAHVPQEWTGVFKANVGIGGIVP